MRETLKGKTNRKAAKNIMWYFSSKGRKLKEILLSGEFTPSPYATETRIEYGKERHFYRLVNRMSNQKIYSLHDCRALLSMYGQLKHCHSTKILKYISEKINMDMVHKVASENRDTTKIKVL